MVKARKPQTFKPKPRTLRLTTPEPRTLTPNPLPHGCLRPVLHSLAAEASLLQWNLLRVYGVGIFASYLDHCMGQ